MIDRTAEYQRLKLKPGNANPWRRWGPYLAERQWGTVREDYSAEGTAWEYFPHDHARSRAYRWGEDGLAGLSDDQQWLCFAFAFWNGKDAILKERIFGLTNNEGNHGEDVKDLYYYLDATPSHAYLKILYKYPQRAFPYDRLIRENAARSKHDPELELLDTGLLDDDRYFDLTIEYAKASPEDIIVRLTADNRGPEMARLHVLPQLWFRNTWTWKKEEPRPELRSCGKEGLLARHAKLGDYECTFETGTELLFCENETNYARLYGAPAEKRGRKDGIHDWVIAGDRGGLNPGDRGTKCALYSRWEIESGESKSLWLRLRRREEEDDRVPGGIDRRECLTFLEKRKTEADEFYSAVQEGLRDPEARRVQRQALAGMIWSKQFFHLEVRKWSEGDPGQPSPPPNRAAGRNREWEHFTACDILSMPDKWEYPWFAAWDLAFHCIPLAMVDPGSRKSNWFC